jgi:hypothetical protein
METARIERGKTSAVQQLAASKRFSRYKDEKSRTVKEPDIADDSCPTLIRAWRMLCVKDYYSEPTSADEIERYLDVMVRCSGIKYQEILDGRPYGFRATGDKVFSPELSVRSLDYEPGDIKRLSAVLGSLLEDDRMCPQRTGLFLSALANLHSSPSFSVITSAMHPIPRFLGFRNRKTLGIHGEAGTYLGASMEDGEISVDGKARIFTGCKMEGGLIHIKGDSAGVPHNLGGLIIIDGDIVPDSRGWRPESKKSAEQRLAHREGNGLLKLKGRLRWD